MHTETDLCRKGPGSDSAILRELLGEAGLRDPGKLIATGPAKIMEEIRRRGTLDGKKPCTEKDLELLEQKLKGHPMAQLFESAEGALVIISVKSVGPYDSHGLDDFMRAFDTRGGAGRDRFGQSGFGFESSPFRIGATKRKQPEIPLAPFLVIACGITSAMLLYYSRGNDEDTAESASDLAEHIMEAAVENPTRFGNVSRRLQEYGFDLQKVAIRLEDFAEKPTKFKANALSSTLARMAPALICLVKDTNRDVEEMQQV